MDNDDCFIHTLANYARQTGAEVVTYRAGFPPELIAQVAPSLILISPGPGPARGFRRAGSGEDGGARWACRCSACAWGCRGSWRRSAANWACSTIRCTASRRRCGIAASGVFEGLPEEFQVGRYHSLFARRETFPACLEVTAETEDGVIMGVRHRELPIEAVQFHPESILTAEGDHGLKLMENAVQNREDGEGLER